METHEDWSLPPATTMKKAKQVSMPSSISQIFRKPAKIVKTNSRNNSPRNSTRRRTSVNVPTRTRSMADNQRIQPLRHRDMPTLSGRPLSWHPQSTQAGSFDSMLYGNWMPSNCNFNYPGMYYDTTEVNGLITPVSNPVMDEPQIQEHITPLEEFNSYNAVHHTVMPNYGSFNPYWTSNDHSKYIPDYSLDASQTTSNAFDFSLNTNSHYVESSTAPPTPNFLPIQSTEHDLVLSPLDSTKPKEEQEELIAMGLYDSPADVQSASNLFDNALGISGLSLRKNLKLEESFEPIVDELEYSYEGQDDPEEPASFQDCFSSQDTGYAEASMSNLMNHSFYFENDSDTLVGSSGAANGANISSMGVPSYANYGWI